MNALFSRLTKKTLIVATIAISFGVAGGLAILSTTGDVTAAGPAMSPGFIKGPNPARRAANFRSLTLPNPSRGRMTCLIPSLMACRDLQCLPGTEF